MTKSIPNHASVGALLLTSLLMALPAQAADATPPASSAASGAAASANADGEVRRIDKAQGRVTLRHGEIKSLDMPPMTMVFRVRDAKLLDGLAVGDKVRFDAVQADGQYVVTTIIKAPAKAP
jgi:Cu(I)/Ag(I) efflux system periplasmic protein CusF